MIIKKILTADEGWFVKISGAEYVTIISLTVGAYIGGSTTQKVMGKNE